MRPSPAAPPAHLPPSHRHPHHPLARYIHEFETTRANSAARSAFRLDANAQIMQSAVIGQRYRTAMLQATPDAVEFKGRLKTFREVSEAYVSGNPVPGDLDADKFVEDHGGAGGVGVMCYVKPNHAPAEGQVGYMPVVITERKIPHPRLNTCAHSVKLLTPTPTTDH